MRRRITAMPSGLEAELEELVARLGFELVTLERGGGRRRPLLRLRMDRPGGRPGRSSVTVEDCARVSRAVREYLDSRPDGDPDYILEVSSPGVERPLVRARDYERFAGQRVRVRGYGPLAGGSRQLEAVLLGLRGAEDDGGQVVELEVEGERIGVPLSSIARAELVYRCEDDL